MKETSPVKNVIVVGGGAIGVSTAVHLLRQAVDVTLVTEAGLASGASGRSLSWLNSAGTRTKEYHELRMAGIERYRVLSTQYPNIDWLSFGGGLFWDGNSATTGQRHEAESARGYSSLLLDAASAAETAPGANPEAIPDSAVFNAAEGWVSLPHLISHLMEEFSRRGGRLVLNAGRAEVLVEAGRAVGVTTETAGKFTADAVLVACGPQTPEVVAPLGVHIDDASPVSMLVITEPGDHEVPPVMNTPRVALRPNPGGTLALDHDWYEQDITEHADGSYDIPRAVVDELVQEASKVLHGAPQLAAASWKIGRKPIPGDGEPVFGELEGVPGCFVAFTHSGATLALVAGELLSKEISVGVRHPMLETFRPERFARQERRTA
ncbi:FAD-dependent oxidoreductase [Arthrobacter rhombi]|uniref:NAD(P)/FAD-dependent oxidoreductase n=1 Tax=Arthrobacter rhombi TaxID=71253 RepID=UPI0031CF35E6